MGQALAGIFQKGIEAQDGDQADLLDAAASTSGVARDAVDRLLEGASTHPPEGDVRKLLEAASVEDVDAAITAARTDGDHFEGDELDPISQMFTPVSPRLLEAVGDGAGVPDAPDAKTRRYRVVVARPCEGKGPGARIYEAAMLKREAANFGGQPIFFNHEDLKTIMERGHGSRDPRDLAGFLPDPTTFDENYSEPDDVANGFKKGAVMGEADFLLEAANYIDALPGAVKLSMNMDPKKLRAKRRTDGKLGTLVEGVVKGSGSIDLITGRAGAGGAVLDRLRESAEVGYSASRDDEDLSEVPDDRLIEAARQRPEVLAALRSEGEPVSGENENEPITEDRLVEAMSTGAGAEVLQRMVESAVADREDTIREEVRAEGRREVELRDMRDEARRLVESDQLLARFPSFADSILSDYTLDGDGQPSAKLDVLPEYGDDGTTVVKTSIDRLRESVAADIERETNKLREAAPTRVQLPAQPEASEDGGEGGEGGEPPKRKDPLAEEMGLDSERVERHRTGSHA